MTKFKVDMILALLILMLGRSILTVHIDTELSDSAFMAAMQWGELLFGYACLTGGAVMAFWTVMGKIARS